MLSIVSSVNYSRSAFTGLLDFHVPGKHAFKLTASPARKSTTKNKIKTAMLMYHHQNTQVASFHIYLTFMKVENTVVFCF